jgi:protein-tyrosine kinase
MRTTDRLEKALELAANRSVRAASLPDAAEGQDVDLVTPPKPLPIFANPPILKFDRAALQARRVTFADDASPVGHSYRMLRAQLRDTIRERKVRVVGVVSATQGDGKTLTALNLALTLVADPEYAVTLLELDLRRPGLLRLLDLQPARGVDDYIAGNVAVTEAAFALEGVGMLQIYAARAPIANSSVVLGGERVQHLLGSLRAAGPGQITLVDLPPALLSDDVLTVLRNLDGVVVVCNEGRTQRQDLQRLQQLLQAVPVLGVVLNRASDAETRAY